MSEILETKHLEFDNSAFLIDLIKHESGNLYIEIMQTIGSDLESSQTIKINPSILTNLLRVLQNFQAKIPNTSLIKKHITDSDQQKIQDYYLKGVSVENTCNSLDISIIRQMHYTLCVCPA